MCSEPGLSLAFRPAERRSVPRLSVSGEPARIAWKQGGFRLCKAPARLIDINEQGAGLLASRPAQPGQTLWLGIASLPWEWVKATVRAVSADAWHWRYHVAFCEPCPAGLLEQAVGLYARNQEVPSFRILADDDNEGDTCFTIQLL